MQFFKTFIREQYTSSNKDDLKKSELTTSKN